MTIFSILLFSLGTIILMIKNNFIYFLLGLELMLLSINIIVLQIAIDAHSFELIFVNILLLVLAAVESAIGLSIIVSIYNLIYTVKITDASRLKG
jgi:NADH-quinone oxidoreductase subunit K